jgi:hypothetical protein
MQRLATTQKPMDTSQENQVSMNVSKGTKKGSIPGQYGTVKKPKINVHIQSSDETFPRFV